MVTKGYYVLLDGLYMPLPSQRSIIIIGNSTGTHMYHIMVNLGSFQGKIKGMIREGIN